jgi:membrane dipeptidase
MILVDAHEDLAYNTLVFQRDYTRSALETRRLEAGTPVIERNGDTLLGWPEYQRGRVAVIFSTLFVTPARRREGEWDWMSYTDTSEANRLFRQQVDVYHRLANEHPDQFKLILSRSDLDEVVNAWEQPENPDPEESKDEEGVKPRGKPVGLVILMEGAEGVRHPDELEEWWELGVRWIGPAWAGTRYCGGTREPGPLTKEGFALLEGMAELGFGLDISHMDEAAALQALDRYPGTIIASHSNVWSLLRNDSNRHLSDPMLRSLIERDGMTGVVPYNHFLKKDWGKGDKRQEVSLHHLVAHIDAVCQAAGSAKHVGLGTDFDGGFGLQSVPAEIDTIADLQKLIPLLGEKGYSPEDIASILAGNWLERLRWVLK